MRSKSFRIVLNIAVIISMLLPNVTAFAAHARPPERASAAQPRPAPDSGLFRTRVQVDSPARWQRLESLGVVILQRDEDSALVLVDDQQLEALARLRFQPRGSDELGALAAAQGKERAWLRAVLQPLLRQGAALQAQARAAKAGAGVDADALTAARADLRSAMHALTPEQRAGIASSISPDDDGDGLTNTEESWWCTDSMNPDSDGDGASDGDEVLAVQDWLGNQATSAPATGKPFVGWPPDHVNCYDDDSDSVPDMAERWELGLNMNNETTDGDKFDDGQELFGITKSAYGDYPRSIDSNFISSNMPGWVDPPGNSPFVAAYPIIDVMVIPSTVQIVLRTEITAGESHSVGESFGYATSETKGTSTGVGKTETHSINSWQEVGNSIADGVERSQYSSVMESRSQQYSWEHSIGQSNEIEYGRHEDISHGESGEITIGASINGEVNASVGLDTSIGGSVGEEIYGEGTIGLTKSSTRGESFAARQATTEQTSYGATFGYEISREQGQSYSVSQVYERSCSRGIGLENSQATTFTREHYNESSTTQEHEIATEQQWSTATAIDTSHSADLSFQYRIINSGTDNARYIGNILFNIYIGNKGNPISVTAGNTIGSSCVVLEKNNLFPGELYPEVEPATQCGIPLTLDQVKAIDNGASIRIVVVDYDLGDDAEFYENAWGNGVIVEIDDDTWDGDEEIESYLIPTWGNETYQDIIRRYFPVTEDIDGNIVSIFTPEYSQTHEIAEWREHAISGRSWWNVYLSDYGNGQVIRFRDRVALPETRILLRFNSDTDADFFSDRAERKYNTDLEDPGEHPYAQVIAGYAEVPLESGGVQVQLALENTGTFAASGVQAMMFAADSSISVDSAFVGGAGLIPAGNKILLTSRILPPEPGTWSENTQPAVSGHFENLVDTTYAFTVTGAITDTGFVGETENLMLEWASSEGGSGSVNIGAGYQPPTNQSIDAGIMLAMGSGPVHNGDNFTVKALAPRDVFSYTVNSQPATPPIIIVSYNDPSGNHRIITPVKLNTILDDLSQYEDQMIPAPQIEVLSNSQFDETGQNFVSLSVTNPTDTEIKDGQIIIAFATLEGEVVYSKSIPFDFKPGPNVHTEAWSVSDFEIPYDNTKQYKIAAFATDRHNRPFAVSIEHFVELGSKTKPKITVYPDAPIDFGIVAQGQILNSKVTVVNTGVSEAWVWLDKGTPIAVAQQPILKKLKPGEFTEFSITIDTASLPTGSFSSTVELRSNDINTPTRMIEIVGTIAAPSAMATQIDPMRPWDESIYIPGQHNENEIIEVTSAVEQTNELRPLYLFDEGGSPIGFGNDALGLNGVGQAPPSASEACTLGVKSFHQTAENSSSLSPLPEESKIDVSAQPELTTSTQVIVETPSLTPSYYNDMCGSAWHRLTNNRGHYFYLTLNTNNPADSMNSGKWKPNLPQSGRYNVDAYIATHPEFDWQCPSRHISGDTHDARYKIHHKDGTTTVSRDQFPLNNQWLDLGTYRFNAGTSGDVILSDLNGEANLTRSVSFSAMRFTLQPPDKPTLNDISNPSNANSYSVNWQSGFGASGYQWQERYNGGSWGSAQSTSSTSITRSDRTPGVWCYRVRSTNSAGSSAWTAEKCTSVKPYTAPVLDPISNSDSDGSYAVNWSAVSGATSYTLQEKHDSGAWSTIYTGASTSQNLTGRTSGVWSYQVRANNSAGSGPWSNTVSTTVNTSPNKPINLNPADDTGVLGRALNLNWQDGGDPDNAPNAYREFQVKIQNDGWSHTSDWSQDTNWQGVVPQDSVYSWQVEAFDGLETSGWTDAQTLRVYSIAKTSPDNIAVALPNSVTDYVRYQVQYGVIANLPSASTPEIVHITVPKRVYSEAYLDMIISEPLTGEITYDIDVGNNGANIWHGSVTGNGGTPALVESPNLAEAFNAYLAAQPEGGGEPVTIPISISLDTAGVVYLTHAVLTPGVDSDPSVQAGDISFGQPNPTETDVVHISAQVHNDGSYRAENVVATFYAVDAENRSFQIGTDFLSSIDASAVGQVGVDWNTTGFTGPTDIKVVLDAANQLDELDETNNVVTATLTILTRPDLAIPAIGLSDEEPMAGETVTVTLPISNSGQTAAASAVTALSVQAPDGSTSTLCEPSLAVGAGAQASAACAWTPAAPGRYRLLVQADRDNGVDESNEGNNQRWRDVYVGLASPILLDSGGDSDAAYDPATGYGYLNGQANTFCGAEPEHSQRTNASGPVKYRFDHLLPGHFYHLDVTLYECDGVGRQEKIWVDDNPVSDMVDLADHNVHALSFLLDPAFYADRSIEVSIEELLGNDVVVAGVNLYDVDYRYADAGGGDDLPYDAMRGYGWVDGVAQTNWGTLPYRSRRIDLGDSDPSDDPDNQLVYRFDALDPDKRYQVHFVFYQASGSAVHQEIAIDGYNTGATVDLDGEQRVDLTVDVPPGAYSADGTIQVYINRTDASTSAFVNEIALEELTIGPNETNMITQVKSLHPTSPNWVSFFVKPPVQGPNECSGVTQTSSFTSVAGEALLAGANAPLDSVVEAYSASGDKVGCFQVSTPGLYGYMRIYGNPGMSDGEPVFFKINGIPAQSDPPYFIWHDDKGVHTLNLDAPDLIPVETMAQSIWDHFSRLQCQNGTYLPPPADQRYNTCHTVTPGRGYLLYTDAAADWNLTGVPLAEDAPLPLEAGWNWLGYLPQCELSVETALASISGQYDLIHSEAGTYLPPPADPAFNNFNTLAPTLGYMIHTTAAVTLTYPAGQCGQLLHDQVEPVATEDCQAVATGQFSSYYGYAMEGEEPFPPGASIRVLSPRGEVVGCGQVQQDGLFPYLRVYGQDGDLPGMVYGETPAFFIDGRPVLPEPAVVWMPDMSVHQVQLNPPPGQLYLPMLTVP